MNKQGRKELARKIGQVVRIPVNIGAADLSKIVETIHEMNINGNDVEIMVQTPGIGDKKNTWFEIKHDEATFMATQEQWYYFTEFKVPFTHHDIIITSKVEYITMRNEITMLRFKLKHKNE